jgi:diguanylate cyclase (GGDEF)-like protein
MSEKHEDIREFHWIMDMLQTIDVGLVVLNKDYKVQVWNSFMENHSGLSPRQTKDELLFDIFTELDQTWFRNKADSVFLLKNRSFMTWEQRPYLFKFKNYRPITGTEEHMFQNVTITPLQSASGEVGHICIIIYDVTDIASNRKALERANSELEKLSRTDRLTELNNRGFWEECLAREFNRYLRYHTPCALVMFDIDHFKRVNDTYGHQAGDEVIRTVSKILRDNLRPTDIAGRYGGEEFGVILSNTDSEHAQIFCERVRQEIEKLTVNHEGQDIRFTISLGISEAVPELRSYKVWLERTDQALYYCKEHGRNQSHIWIEEDTENAS